MNFRVAEPDGRDRIDNRSKQARIVPIAFVQSSHAIIDDIGR